MWIANVCVVSPILGQAVIAVEPNRPSRFLIVGADMAAAGYRGIYERALLDGRPVLVAAEQAPAVIDAARKTAVERGWHFCVAAPEDGFRPGLHELVVRANRLVFRERRQPPPQQLPQRCDPRTGCDT